MEVSTDIEATPETIWETCFANMNWETFFPDVIDVVKGSSSNDCRDGARFIMIMKDTNSKYPITLSNVIRNQSVTFKGWGTKGTFRIRPVTSTTSRVDFW